MKTLSALLLLGIFLYGCSDSNGNKTIEEMNQPYRPQYHFSPKTGWMNDPNGMVYYAGQYHVFYQHHPASTVWGPMHWGHAVSKDLIHWEHLPIAIYPDSLGMIFSGSAVLDKMNSSGLGTVNNPPLVAMFTYHNMPGEQAGRNDYQTQGIAFSLDSGSTWTKYSGNPVIRNPGIRDFRDPKLSWWEEGSAWIVTLAVKDHIEFYGSNDLINWTKLSEFGQTTGNHGGVWECPDLFKIKDNEGVEQWVLLVSINPGAPKGGSGTQYFIGDFKSGSFIAHDTITRWIELNDIPKSYEFDLLKMSGIKIDYSKYSSKQKDQFFTPVKTAQYCFEKFCETIKEFEETEKDFNFIEPSAGDGARWL